MTVSAPLTSTTEFLNRGEFNPITTLVAGPCWKSFEDLRTSGNSGLEIIPTHGVATLRSKAGTFRILRDVDFQAVVGLASEVFRLQKGLKVVIQAAKVAVKHPDNDHVQLLIQSAMLITEAPELPLRQGHLPFDLTSDEMNDTAAEDEFDLANATIPRPRW